MAEQSQSVVRTSRRQFLGAAATGVASIGFLGGRARAWHENYSNHVDVVEAGADPTGEESCSGVIDDVIDDDTLLVFPEGEYYMDEQVRFTDFENVGLDGNDSRLVPAPADEFSGESRLFKLGTHYAPGRDLRIQDFEVDFRAENTGLRAFQLQIADGLTVRNVEVLGQHDAGTWGPFLFDITHPDGNGRVTNVSAVEGGAFTEDTEQDATPTVGTGPTGIIVSPYHEGKLVLDDVALGPFPDNGLYDSGESGQVVVLDSEFRNSNVANVRFAGDGNAIHDSRIVVDDGRASDMNQRGIRLDSGDLLWVNRTEIVLAEPNGDAITVNPDVTYAKVQETDITVGDAVNDAVVVEPGAGEVDIVDSTIEMNGGGQAVEIHDGDGTVLLEYVEITGDASGARGGRNAVRTMRDGSEFRALTVDQPGDGYRRALGIHADDCIVAFGDYRATHHPIVNNGDGTTIYDVTARSYDGYEALKSLDGTEGLDIYYSTLYEGYENDGGEVGGYSNEYPDA